MIRCIVIDDEPLAVQQIEQYVEKTADLELKGSFITTTDALTFLHNNQIDLILVDINMPQITGLEFVEALPYDIKVIFITAYREYAAEGFLLDAADYLLKPLSYASFLKSIEKIRQRYFNSSSKENKNEFFFVRSEYRSVRINFDDIMYIESKREYLDIVLTNDEIINTHGALSNISDKLPQNKFIRVHRSFIVNLDHVKVIERNSIVFGKQYIPINEQSKDIIMDFINGNVDHK